MSASGAMEIKYIFLFLQALVYVEVMAFCDRVGLYGANLASLAYVSLHHIA
jgi:hypothetical protein